MHSDRVMQESIQAGDAAFVVVTQIFRPFVNLSIRGQNRALLVVAGRNEGVKECGILGVIGHQRIAEFVDDDQVVAIK